MIEHDIFEDLAEEDERDAVHEPMMRLITFFLDSECYGVEVNRVREILRIAQVFPVPGAVDCVAGITNIRGSVVTIIDGRKRIGLATREYDGAVRMIVVESGEEVAAVIVDRVSNVIDVPISRIENSPNLSVRDDAHYVEGVVSHEGKLIILLNVDRLITDGRVDKVAGF